MDSFQTEIQNVEKFLRTGEYPADFNANQKRVLRRRAKSFKFRSSGEIAFKDGRKLLSRSEDQQAVIRGMHEGPAGCNTVHVLHYSTGLGLLYLGLHLIILRPNIIIT